MKNIAGHRIRIARAMQKPPISQLDLVARLQIKGVDMTQSILSRIELGERYITDIELQAFSEVLGVGILWLMGKN